MTRQTIAIDIDDVLADQAEAFLEYSNKTWGTNLTIDDYDEHWPNMWGVDLEEVKRRGELYHQSGTMATFAHKSEALPVLHQLKQWYNLVIVTSRRMQVKDETIDWINRHFDGVFDGIHFAGIFDTPKQDRWNMTKASIVKDIGATYLIDDQPKHCFAAAEAGIETILFGDYSWNRSDELPHAVTRCHTWDEVGAYFANKK